jgi:hypothetical protein
MNNDYVEFKSSPFFGIFIVLSGLFIGSFAFYFFFLGPLLGKVAAVLFIMAGLMVAYFGYGAVLIRTVTLNRTGVKFRQGKKIIFERLWNEISKIMTENIDWGESPSPYIEFFFTDNETYKLGGGFDGGMWSDKTLKKLFYELLKYQEIHGFQIDDKLKWISEL